MSSYKYVFTSGFWPRVRARALRAPVFLSSLPPQTGRCAPPPCPSQARRFAAFHSTSKIYKIYPTWAAHVKGFFHSTGSHADCRGYEIWGPLSLPHPSQLRWSFRQYFGVKMYRCDHRPYLFSIFPFCIAFNLFFLLFSIWGQINVVRPYVLHFFFILFYGFLIFSSCYSLLILLFISLFLFFSSYI